MNIYYLLVTMVMLIMSIAFAQDGSDFPDAIAEATLTDVPPVSDAPDAPSIASFTSEQLQQEVLSYAFEQQAFINATSEQDQTNAESTCGPRIRKSWARLTPIEKSVYLRALEKSMDDGLYIRFVELHTEQMTTMEAHQTCMFVYWHRQLLLGFEQMLRSYGGEFSCITVPYFDYASDNARYLNGECSSLEDCSSILREIGGSTLGWPRSVTINGTPVQGTCVQTRPSTHFCEDSRLSPDQCSHCVPRGTWTSTPFPPTTSISSLMRQLFSATTIEEVANNLEQGIHNTMHNSLGGAMALLEAPADIIFFSHHASVDLLHSIYYKCMIGNTDRLTLQQKLNDPRQYVSCQRRTSLQNGAADTNVLLPQSDILMRTGGEFSLPSSVHDPSNPLAPFFASLPPQYMSYSDVRDIGEFSYNYEMSGIFAELYVNCAKGMTLDPPQTSAGFGGFSPSPAGNAFTAGGFPSTGNTFGTISVNGVTGFRRLDDDAGNQLVEAVIVDGPDESDWYREALAIARNVTTEMQTELTEAGVEDFDSALKEVEKMTCMFYEECRAKVDDFTADFEKTFQTGGPVPCRETIDAVQDGREEIAIPGWKELMEQYLDCSN